MIEVNIGAVVKEPGSTIKNKTGSWRVFRPVVDEELCIGCKRCWFFCPDVSIKMVEKNGKLIATIDYDYCKGCGICANECPKNAIKMIREGEE